MLLPTGGFLEEGALCVLGEPVKVLQVPAGLVGASERLLTVAVEDRLAVLDLAGTSAETCLLISFSPPSGLPDRSYSNVIPPGGGEHR